MIFTNPKLDQFQSGAGEAAWNNILRECDGFLGTLPTAAIVEGNKIVLTFPENVAATSKVNLPVKIHAGTVR